MSGDTETTAHRRKSRDTVALSNTHLKQPNLTATEPSRPAAAVSGSAPRIKKSAQEAVEASIASEWSTSSGISPDVHTICDSGVVVELADYLEQGCPIGVALDMAGVPEDVYRDWMSKANAGSEPYTWAQSLLKKAQAAYIYTQVIELNMADGSSYKKYLEILKLRNGSEWGGDGLDLTDEEFDAEFL